LYYSIVLLIRLTGRRLVVEVASRARASSGRVAYGWLLWVGPLAGAIAAVVNAVVYLLASALGAMPSDVVVPGQGPATLGAVVSIYFVPALLGALLFAVMGRFTRRPIRTFRVVAAVVLVLSFATPFTLPGAPVAMIAALLVMHVIAAAVIIGVLTTLGRRG
jgi:hypothetical protein